MSFAQLPSTLLGDIGEEIVYRRLNDAGVSLYSPPDGPHVIDRLAINSKGLVFALDVKTYPRRYSGPYTGIDRADYEKYKALTPVPVVIYFVDAFERCIYLYHLNPEGGHRAPKFEGNKAYFHLSEMAVKWCLTPDELTSLHPIKNADRYARALRYFNAATNV